MLCAFAHQFPTFVEKLLDKDRALRRNFREETITDLLMGGLVTAGGKQLIVEFPDEPATGADMEWNFVDRHKGTFFRLLVQAKRIHGYGAVWTRHCYRELLHKTGNSSRLQADVLDHEARTSASTYPLYIFYNSGYTCSLAGGSGSIEVDGVNIADGYSIIKLVRAATTRALRTSNKSLKVIAPMLAPLSTLFCPPRFLSVRPFALSPAAFPTEFYISGGRSVVGSQIPPTPDDVRERLIRLRETAAAVQHVKERDQVIDPLPIIPEVSNRVPDDIQAVLRRGSEVSGKCGLNRWRLTFISDSSHSEFIE